MEYATPTLGEDFKVYQANLTLRVIMRGLMRKLNHQHFQLDRDTRDEHLTSLSHITLQT